MPTWSTRGLRGSYLEDIINRTNELYLQKGLCLVQKIPTPITPIEIDAKTRHITLAYFDQKSTVDYIGACQGVPICFDAKECATDTFSLQNIHAHQVQFMLDFQKQGGIAFFLIYYKNTDAFYYMNINEMNAFVTRSKEGGRKSFRYDELKEDHFLPKKKGVLVPYLDMIAKDVNNELYIV